MDDDGNKELEKSKKRGGKLAATSHMGALPSRAKHVLGRRLAVSGRRIRAAMCLETRADRRFIPGLGGRSNHLSPGRASNKNFIVLCYSSTSTVYSSPTYNFARAGFPLNSASIVRFEILQFSQPTHSPAKPSPSRKARAADAAPALETSHPVSVSVPNSSTLDRQLTRRGQPATASAAAPPARRAPRRGCTRACLGPRISAADARS